MDWVVAPYQMTETACHTLMKLSTLLCLLYTVTIKLYISVYTNPCPLVYTQAKALLMDDLGKDLASVDALIRKHEELERDISAIDAKLEVSFYGSVSC